MRCRLFIEDLHEWLFFFLAKVTLVFQGNYWRTCWNFISYLNIHCGGIRKVIVTKGSLFYHKPKYLYFETQPFPSWISPSLVFPLYLIPSSCFRVFLQEESWLLPQYGRRGRNKNKELKRKWEKEVVDVERREVCCSILFMQHARDTATESYSFRQCGGDEREKRKMVSMRE